MKPSYEMLGAVFLLSSDSPQVGIVFGAIFNSWRLGSVSSLLFVVYDAAAALLGVVIPHAHPICRTSHFDFCVVLAVASRNNAARLFALPFPISFDNFIAGRAAAETLIIVINCGAMTLTGITIGIAGQNIVAKEPVKWVLR
jgi:hypothetical protein